MPVKFIKVLNLTAISILYIYIYEYVKIWKSLEKKETQGCQRMILFIVERFANIKHLAFFNRSFENKMLYLNKIRKIKYCIFKRPDEGLMLKHRHV